uniref:acetoacetyl-CoA synthetase-like n=1 Tax=Ciona intestinalis TaxID=7719 RepID=UPI000180B173|nr:acetoacetyl-CoA synthetase-like [Ciona intestinalis]|eukprot:XP_002129031.1 acetoacetyl-CoA synthetase-like [Ciona intestinalis]
MGPIKQDSEKALNRVMWTPDFSVKDNNMINFMQRINKKYNLALQSYDQLWEWSTKNYAEFWGEVWDIMEIVHSTGYVKVVDVTKKITDNPEWFSGARINYAENMLRYDDDKVAILSAGEGRNIESLSYKELRIKVALYSSALRKLGIESGDRVVGYIPNCTDAVVIMLAAASIGAIWSSTSPDFGVSGVLDRFQQIKPKIIFSVDAVRYNNKIHTHLDKLRQVVNGLADLQSVVVIPFVNNMESVNIDDIPKSMMLSSFLQTGSTTDRLQFEQLPFNHPLFIMYSSGTTGPPKCMVHSAGGTLIQHMKEHILHGNMMRSDKILYYTTTGWMMWNWLVGALSSGATIVLYDGSPFQPKANVMFDLIDSLKITILGTSAKCLDVMEKYKLEPIKTHNLSTLHTVLSTGSPLAGHQYDYVYNNIKADVLLGSITGGTDIISCFIGQNWTVPVHRGELQSANLGMSVACFLEDEEGNAIQVYDKPAELVCTVPFPCMPTCFWNDDSGELYRNAYFSKLPGVWCHGDYCMQNSQTNGFVMLGRSDATLNPNGVRFGTSELYSVIESRFKEEINDSVAAAYRKYTKDSTSYTENVILFLKMADGFSLDMKLENEIRQQIRAQLTPRHVPAILMQVQDIPYTISGKKVEMAVTQILAGMDVKHKGAFKNPEALELYKNIVIPS